MNTKSKNVEIDCQSIKPLNTQGFHRCLWRVEDRVRHLANISMLRNKDFHMYQSITLTKDKTYVGIFKQKLISTRSTIYAKRPESSSPQKQTSKATDDALLYIIIKGVDLHGDLRTCPHQFQMTTEMAPPIFRLKLNKKRLILLFSKNIFSPSFSTPPFSKKYILSIFF